MCNDMNKVFYKSMGGTFGRSIVLVEGKSIFSVYFNKEQSAPSSMLDMAQCNQPITSWLITLGNGCHTRDSVLVSDSG